MSEFSVADSRVVVVGAGRSGIAAARLLAGRGARVTLSEAGKEVACSESLADQGIEVEVGGHRADTLGAADLIVSSPACLRGCRRLPRRGAAEFR